MKKLAFTIAVCLVILFLSGAIIFDIIPPIFWSFQAFSNPNYLNDLEREWSQKSSTFLLLKLHSIDFGRFGLAAYLLGQRKETQAVAILVKKIRSPFVDSQIHFSACSALAQISPSTAKKVLFEIIEKYKNVQDHNLPEYGSFKHALHILAVMKDERAYPICLEWARSDNRLKREASLNAMLYYFDNHYVEILPLYLNYLMAEESPKGQVLKAIENLKRREAIPALEEFAIKDKDYKKATLETIIYLRDLTEK